MRSHRRGRLGKGVTASPEMASGTGDLGATVGSTATLAARLALRASWRSR